MTTPTGPILFNNSTGSDSAASGLGPATAVTGTGASLNATSTVDVSADSPDLSGVTAGHLLWVLTSSGRQFSVIASVDNAAKTITCDDAFAVTESGKTWAVGGKRQTFEHSSSRRVIGADSASGHVIATETDQSITSELAVGSAVLVKSADSVRRQLSASTGVILFSNYARLENLHITTSSTTSRLIRANGSYLTCVAKDCYFGSGAVVTQSVIGGFREYLQAYDCYFYNFSQTIVTQGNSTTCIFDRCVFDTWTSGYYALNTSVNSSVTNCVFLNGSGDGLSILRGSGGAIEIAKNNVFYNVAGTAITCDDYVVVSENLIVNCGVGVANSNSNLYGLTDANVFYGNTSNYSGGGAEGPNDVVLTADPFVDAATGDLNFNSTAGGGAVIRATSSAMPGLVNTTNHPFRQWVSDDFGGGSVIVVEDD